MTLGEWEYRTMHIPGSMLVSTIQEALEALDPEDEIVLYDSGPPCPASRMVFRILRIMDTSAYDATPEGWRSGQLQAIRSKARTSSN